MYAEGDMPRLASVFRYNTVRSIAIKELNLTTERSSFDRFCIIKPVSLLENDLSISSVMSIDTVLLAYVWQSVSLRSELMSYGKFCHKILSLWILLV